MNPKKEKGRRLELAVAALIREKLGIKATRSPYSGAGEIKGDIYAPDLDFHIECKNREYISIWKEWEKIKDFKRPVLVISKAFKSILVVMDFKEFLEIIKRNHLNNFYGNRK